jgi:hypothetical protein
MAATIREWHLPQCHRILQREKRLRKPLVTYYFLIIKGNRFLTGKNLYMRQNANVKFYSHYWMTSICQRPWSNHMVTCNETFFLLTTRPFTENCEQGLRTQMTSALNSGQCKWGKRNTKCKGKGKAVQLAYQLPRRTIVVQDICNWDLNYKYILIQLYHSTFYELYTIGSYVYVFIVNVYVFIVCMFMYLLSTFMYLLYVCLCIYFMYVYVFMSMFMYLLYVCLCIYCQCLCTYCMYVYALIVNVYVFIVFLCIFIVPAGTLQLPWLGFFRAFSSFVRKIPG